MSRGEPPLSIVHVLAPAPFGGLESVVHALATGQAEWGHGVHVLAVVTPGSGEHPLVARLRSVGVDAVQLDLPGRAYFAERRRVAAFCRKVGADVLHTHGFRPDVLHAAVARRLGIPQVSTVHGFIGGTWKSRLYERLQVRAYRRLGAVIAVSRPLVHRLVAAGVPRERIHLLPNAFRPCELLDTAAARATLGVPAGAFHIGWVGRLSREKGADVLLDAIDRLPDIPVVVSFIGDGAERAALEARATAVEARAKSPGDASDEALGASEVVRDGIRTGVPDRLMGVVRATTWAEPGRIRWQGSHPEAGRLYRAFDLFVLSSRTEGTPISLFEAMAAGVPIVATAVGGVPDVVTEREAILIPPEDPDALAAAIRAIFDDPEAARARGRAARERLKAYAPGPWLVAHERIYRSLRPTNATLPRDTMDHTAGADASEERNRAPVPRATT